MGYTMSTSSSLVSAPANDARTQAAFSAVEKRAVISLASLYALRMLGLFMVLPVMMLEGSKLEGATPQLLGLAMGVYGLTQALLQIPAGTLSDRIGRKPIIVGGLIISVDAAREVLESRNVAHYWDNAVAFSADL